ncbi:MAG: hypothetical protein JNK72_23400 [Myxococcales bacterium]|nr:hypothetical protein [Myxococcales bacterium]
MIVAQSPSRWFSTGGRGGGVLAAWCSAQIFAWLWAWVGLRTLGAPLETRPEGALALLGEGGRLAMDYAALQQNTLRLYGEATALMVAAWWLAWLFLGGAFAAMGTAAVAPTVHRAVVEAARRFKSLLAIELVTVLAMGLSVGLGWYGWRYLDRVDAGLVDAQRADLRHGAVVLGAAVLFALVRCWRDVAVAFVTGDGRRALEAAGDALGAFARRPHRTLGAGLGWALAGWAPTALLGLATVFTEWRAGAAVVLLMAGVQQLASWWGYHCRMKWFVSLGEHVLRRRG